MTDENPGNRRMRIEMNVNPFYGFYVVDFCHPRIKMLDSSRLAPSSLRLRSASSSLSRRTGLKGIRKSGSSRLVYCFPRERASEHLITTTCIHTLSPFESNQLRQGKECNCNKCIIPHNGQGCCAYKR